MKKGIDVSKWNGNINWDKVDVDFAIVRAGFGKNNLDPKAHQNCLRCNQLNIPVGLYWFSYAYTPEMAAKEAEYAIAFAKAHMISLPIWFDFEYDSVTHAEKNGKKISTAVFHSLVKNFCEKIEQHKYYAGFYVNKDFYNRYNCKPLAARYDMWLAEYTTPTDKKLANMRQYSATGSMSGIDGKVDLDISFIDYPAVILKAGLNNLKKED